MSHYGYLKTIQIYNDLAKGLHDLQRNLEVLNGDGSWMGVNILCLSLVLGGFTKYSIGASPRTYRSCNQLR